MKLKYYLIASPENNYRPWILTNTALACFCISIWALRLFVPSAVVIGAPGLDNQDLMNRINNERTSRFIPALITNAPLNSAANIKSSDMIARSYFAHVNPDGDYVWPVIESQGYKPYQALGENLAIDFESAANVVTAWMNSPGHRANILNEKFEDQGMAAVYGEYEEGHNTYLITNLFGTLLKVNGQTTTKPAPSPSPSPTPVASQSPSPTPTPTTALTPTPTPTQSPTAVPERIETFGEQNPAPTSETGSNEKSGLVSLKILMAIFAGSFAFFLIVDSIIIHRARIYRTNLPSSSHAILFILVAIVNIFTLWF